MVCRFAVASNPILRAKKALLTFCKRRPAEPFVIGHQRQPPALPGEKIAYGEGQSRQEKVSELE